MVHLDADKGTPGKEDKFSRFKPRMKPDAPGTFNARRTVLLSLSFTTVLLAWSYFNFKVPLLLEELIPPNPLKDFVKGLIMALDNLVAVLLQPYFGELSDRTGSKLGRRMPYLLVGTLSAAFFFIVLPWVRVFLGFVIVVFCFDVAMSFYRSVSIAILPDYTPDESRSKASSIQQFIANMGGVVGFAIPIIAGALTGLSSDWERAVGFLIVALVMVVLMVLQLCLVKETPTGEKWWQVYDHDLEIDPYTFEVKKPAQAGTPVVKDRTAKVEVGDAPRDPASKSPTTPVPGEKESIYKEIGTIFRADEKSFPAMLLVVFFAYLAFASIEAFFSNFGQSYLGKAEAVSSTLFLAYSVPMILSAPAWGALGQKIGRKKAVKVGFFGIVVAMGVFSFVLVPLSYNPVPAGELETTLTTLNWLMMVNLACISMPWMCFIVNSFPIIWSLAPEGRVGAYTGIYYTFNQLAYTLGPIVMGLILSAFTAWGEYRYVVMFPAILIMIVASYAFMTKVKRGDVKLTPEQEAEYRQKYEQVD